MPPALILQLSNLYSTLNLTNLKVLGLVCVFPSLLGMSDNSLSNTFTISIFAPAAVFLLIFFFLIVKKLIKRCLRIENEEASLKKQTASAMIFIAYFSFFNASTLFISTFSCKTDPSGDSYMNSKPYQSVRCYSEEWYIMLKAASAGCCLFILLPLLIFSFLLHKCKDSLHEPSTASWLGYLYTSYKPNDNMMVHTSWRFFEILFMVYRFVLAVSISIPESDSIWKPIGTMIVLLAIIPVFLFIKPYTYHSDNVAAFIAILSLIFTLFVATTINPSSQDPTIALIIIMLVNIVIVLMFIGLILGRGRESIKAHWKELKSSIVGIYVRLKRIKDDIFHRNEDSLESIIQEQP